MNVRHGLRIVAVLLAITALSLPGPAWSKAGGGSSMGSRGSRTYQQSPSTAAPVQRSVTPPPSQQPAPGQYGPSPQRPYYAPQPMGHPFLSGMAGGFMGMALGHMLFGSHGFGMGGGGGPGLIHLLLVGLVIYLIFRVLRGGLGGLGGFGMRPQATLFSGPVVAAQPQRQASQPLQLMESDAAMFKALFIDIQDAWSHGDLARLQRDMTPEMVQYFNEQISANSSRGMVNKVENVNIQDIQPVESWREFNMDYASVAIRWTARDYMVPLDGQSGSVVNPGSGAVSSDQEQWTFTRAPGGRWLLSAIQQMR